MRLRLEVTAIRRKSFRDDFR